MGDSCNRVLVVGDEKIIELCGRDSVPDGGQATPFFTTRRYQVWVLLYDNRYSNRLMQSIFHEKTNV